MSRPNRARPIPLLALLLADAGPALRADDAEAEKVRAAEAPEMAAIPPSRANQP